MTTELEILLKILSPLLTAWAGLLIKRRFQDRPKLITYIVHSDAISVGDAPNSQVNMHLVVVRNTGKKAAHNVRIGHHELPIGFKVTPPLSYDIVRPPTGTSAEILLPTLAPNEQVIITYLYLPPLTWNRISAYAKCDEGRAKVVDVIPTPRPPRFAVGSLLFMAFVGASTMVYWAFVLIAYVLTRTSA